MSLQTRLSALITAIGADIKKFSTDRTLVTSLPTTGPDGGALQDGQECRYLADATNGIVWNLKYKLSATKWYFIGGGSLFAEVDANESRAIAVLVWADITTVGPSITVPLAGDYMVEWGANINAPANYAANSAGAVLISVGGTQDGNTNITFGTGPAGGTGNAEQSTVSAARKLTLTAAQVLKLQYNSAGTAFSFRWRWLKITPIRVS
jgi:hypothetical protein